MLLQPSGCLVDNPCTYNVDTTRLFRTFDDNGSRSLDREELKNGLADYGLSMSAADVDELFRYFDKDNSGSINFDEFLLALRVSFLLL